VLIDVADVALGHITKMRWNDAGKWIWSEQAAHEPLIDTATFEQAQALRRARGAARRGPRRTSRPYCLRGLLFCGLCQRRMQGSWNNQAAYYRCMFLPAMAVTSAGGRLVKRAGSTGELSHHEEFVTEQVHP
jgi:site-specific DNA recombinase